MKGSAIVSALSDVTVFGGVFASDQLHRIKKGKVYVVNTKPVNHPGEHWIVIDWTTRRPFFFDSFGRDPQTYGFPSMKYSTYKLQHLKSNTGGMYVTYYVVYKSMGYSIERMMKTFTKNTKKNDRFIRKWYTDYVTFNYVK